MKAHTRCTASRPFRPELLSSLKYFTCAPAIFQSHLSLNLKRMMSIKLTVNGVIVPGCNDGVLLRVGQDPFSLLSATPLPIPVLRQ
ncbi:Uncharacterized protein APZ42_014293 [Daphnia magna]|uniref:Uncharacterized protein n=1 Tax=Daphnia magna TaxID=35525 RepID=A0A162Q7B7_9CRUS|nr:Uncharacterized protein APZ42_014293 [Daphnia magna]